MSTLDQILISAAEKKWCLENSVNITCPGHVDYPEGFYDLESRPNYFYYMGNPVWKTHPTISVVGSRAPQSSSLNWLEEILSKSLKNVNLAIVSGGARGIDQKSHQMALRMGRPTVALLPSGLMNMYPTEFKDWIKPILNTGGCVASQFQPASPMHKRFFRERNKLIAALSPMTLIVECKRRSGTLLTANFARDLNRTLCVMPTFPGEAGMGGLDIICENYGQAIRDEKDLLFAFYNVSKLINRKN
jgi:DNA processing protein